jgi:putative phosphoesterase
LFYFKDCHEIWHAGDIGSEEIAQKFAQHCPFRAVYGNMDGKEIRSQFPKVDRFTLEETDIMMTHIGGYPGRYDEAIRDSIFTHPPKLFISGHSHILKVMYDKKLQLLHINPGAAGIYGIQQVRTLVRFAIDKGQFKDLEVIELLTRDGKDSLLV